MRKTGLIILASLISVFIYGQNFETNLKLASLITFTSKERTERTESKIALGFSGAIQEFYNLTDNFAIGSEVVYSFANYKTIMDYSVPISLPFFESKLTSHSLSVPLIIRLKTKSDWSLNFGYGLTYFFNYKVSVDYVYSDGLSKDDLRREISYKSVHFENDFNGYFTIGFGKAFKINNFRLLTELFYNKCFAVYRINHGEVVPDIAGYSYDIKIPQYIGFKIGLGL